MALKIFVVPAAARHLENWGRMRHELWPEATPEEHHHELADFLATATRDPMAAFIAENEDGTPLGFVELTIRSHAEGCAPGNIAYLEGWFVDPAFRGTGVGRALLAACEAWAKANDCREFASDSWSSNDESQKAHLAMGFEEVGTIRCFRKKLV